MALEVDRSNIKQAVTDNLLKELKMNTNGMLSFPTSLSRLLLTIWRLKSWEYRLQASILVCRATVSIGVEVDRTGSIPAQLILWSLAASAKFWLSGRQSFLICRAILSILQGGFIPDVRPLISSYCICRLIGCNLDYPIFVMLLQTP